MRSIVYNDSANLPPPKSLLEGVDEAICRTLQITGLSHRSALLELGRRAAIPRGVVETAYEAIVENWRRCKAAQLSSRSAENWRWRKPQLTIAAHNASAEVVLERALVAACERRGRLDWSNQVPVASGVAGAFAERRRAIDLVCQKAPDHFEFIELKIASDTPLYAAIEIIRYVCIWLVTRAEAKDAASPLLNASRIDAVVLAPGDYYAGYRLKALEQQLHAELAALGDRYGAMLTFAFESFPDHLGRAPVSDANALALIDGGRRRL